MSRVVIYDLADSSRRITVERRQWRATLQLLCRDSVLGKRRLRRLDWRLGGAGTSITQDECVAIAGYVAASLLPCFADTDTVHVPDDAPAFDGVTDGTIGVGLASLFLNESNVPKATVIPRQWLQEFADFLSTAGGVGTIEEAFLPSEGSRQG